MPAPPKHEFWERKLIKVCEFGMSLAFVLIVAGWVTQLVHTKVTAAQAGEITGCGFLLLLVTPVLWLLTVSLAYIRGRYRRF